MTGARSQCLEFDYGEVKVKHRLCVSKPITFEEIIIKKCVRFGLVKKNINMNYDKIWEIQIVYKDGDNRPQCNKYNLEDYQVDIIYKGNMQVEI